MKKFLTFILLAFALGIMSCTPDDVQTTNHEQTITSSNSNPPLEETGDEDELTVNN